MPAKNLYHDAVRDALIADGWTITHDPLGVVIGRRQLFVDVGAERIAFGAERSGERIAVEVQSFVSDSKIDDFHRAVGQYVVYRTVLRQRDPDRVLYLAVPKAAYNGILTEPLGRLVSAEVGMKFAVFHPKSRRIVQWIG